MLIVLEKCFCLSDSSFVKAAVHTAPLNYVLQVKISLSVPNDVDFFAVQFSIILGAKIRNYYRVRWRTDK